MKRKLVWAVAGAVATLALLASGCGGGGGKAYKNLSKAEYARILDGVCVSANKKLASLGKPDMATLKEHGSEAVDIGKDLVKKIKKVTPPDELKDTAKQFNEANQAVVDSLKKVVDAAKNDDKAKFDEALSEAFNSGKESDALATKLGAKGCA